MTVNHEEAAIVQYIFSKYLEHRSLSAVAELCSLKGYSGKRGKPFRAESIRKILTRPIYAGYYSYNGTLIYGGFEPSYRRKRITRYNGYWVAGNL